MAVGVALLSLTSVQLFIANYPARAMADRIDRDIEFAPELGLKLDIYRPETDRPAPVMVFFYGGSWQQGSREIYPFLGETLAREGYLVVVPDYRKYPQVRHPEFVDDAARALAWVHDNIADYGGDAGRIFVSGHSAGAHIAALAITDRRYLAALGKTPAIVSGFVGLAGPYHFTPREPVYVDMFGPPERFDQMQATTFVTGDEPPMLLQYGLSDVVVGGVNLQQFSDALSAAGSCLNVRLYPGVDHIKIVGDFTWLERDTSPIVADMLTFLKSPECIKPGGDTVAVAAD